MSRREPERRTCATCGQANVAHDREGRPFHVHRRGIKHQAAIMAKQSAAPPRKKAYEKPVVVELEQTCRTDFTVTGFVFPCGCSLLKVALGLCDAFEPKDAARERLSISSNSPETPVEEAGET